jgi:hypothetical protein
MKRATVTETTWASFTRKEAHRETVTGYDTAVKYVKSVADRYRKQGYTVVENADCTYFTAVHGAITVELKVTPL